MTELVTMINELENDIMQCEEQIAYYKADMKSKKSKLKKLQKLQDQLTGITECGM